MMKNLIEAAALIFLSTITTLVNGQNECPLLIDDMTCDCNSVNSNQTEYTINCYQQTYSVSDEAIMSIESLNNSSNISSHNEVIKSVFIKDKFIYKLPDFAINTSIPLEWLSLESTQIHEISKDAFSNLAYLERLTLTENNLTRLDFNVIRDLDRLESLELISNRIESIDLCIGKAMNLNELLLGQNFIANLTSFENFPLLNTLNINNNYLEHIESDVFLNLSMLQILDLSYNKISKIDPNSFAGLISLEQLDLDNNYLTFIDESILNGTRNLRNINLNGNKLVDIYSNSFQVNYIDSLDLSYQNIKQIDSKAFSMSTELTTIDLQHNQLKHLNPGFIYNLTALDTIKLSFNLLETLVYDNFGTFDTIKFLHFDNNYISFIEKGAFINLKNLRNLYLNINLLRELNSDMFIGLENLQNLQVDNNKLSVIDSTTFQFLPNLQSISLQFNYITSIEANSFKNQGVLTEIDLNNNQLTEIDEDSFNGLSNLFQINLQGNQIESIAAGAFSDMSSIMYIALSYNKITSLNSGVFNGLEMLSMIDLGSNRLVDIDGAFNDLTNLQSLYLSNNLLDSVNNRTFANLDNLVELDLAFNPLNSVENGSLEQLTELNALTLNNINSNPLKLARLSVFKKLSRLGLSGTQFDINNETFGDNLDTMEYLILRKVGLKDVDNLHLKRMTRLVSLDLSDNNLDWVTFCSTQQLFERAKNLQYLYLSNTSLKDLNCIGLNLPNKLNTLDLSNNQIESIEANVFKFDCVEPYTKRGCLKSLNLNNNPIKVIKPGSFDYVRGLGNLFMNSNMFSSKESLENMNVNLLNWLFILEMSNSNLTIFPLFDRYSENGYKLEKLRLGNNRIEMLSSSHFDYLQGLIYLDLGNNLISRIEYTSIFFGSPKLETLNLSRNLIDDYNLNRINFDLCNNLKYLNLSYNKLTVLNRDLFNGLKKLETIDVSYNGLVQIESNTFNKLSVLKYLYLYGIYFSDAKKSGQTQSTVNISGNFAHGCSLLKFVYISSLDLIESNLDSISSSLKAAEANKIVNGAVYYNSINIIVNNFDYYKSERKNACKLTILFLKHRIHVNLFSDFDFDMFISNCYSLDLIEDLQ